MQLKGSNHLSGYSLDRQTLDPPTIAPPPKRKGLITVLVLLVAGGTVALSNNQQIQEHISQISASRIQEQNELPEQSTGMINRELPIEARLIIPQSCQKSCALLLIHPPAGTSAIEMSQTALGKSIQNIANTLKAATLYVHESPSGSTWGSKTGQLNSAHQAWAAINKIPWNNKSCSIGIGSGGILSILERVEGDRRKVNDIKPVMSDLEAPQRWASNCAILIDAWTSARSAWNLKKDNLLGARGITDPQAGLRSLITEERDSLQQDRLPLNTLIMLSDEGKSRGMRDHGAQEWASNESRITRRAFSIRLLTPMNINEVPRRSVEEIIQTFTAQQLSATSTAP